MSGRQVRLRRWQDESDSLRALTELLHDSYAHHAAQGRPFFASYQTEADTASRLRGGECWLAHLDGALVGTVTVAPPGQAKGNWYYEQEGVGTFYQLAVAPDLTRLGVGKAITAKSGGTA